MSYASAPNLVPSYKFTTNSHNEFVNIGSFFFKVTRNRAFEGLFEGSRARVIMIDSDANEYKRRIDCNKRWSAGGCSPVDWRLHGEHYRRFVRSGGWAASTIGRPSVWINVVIQINSN